jgi:predicted dehydrogenase
LGVGFLGAGPATQSIHLPTLGRLGDRFKVLGVMDIDADLAEQVAAPLGAKAVTDQDELLAIEGLDVVVLCSPNALHAPQTIAAAECGIKAVLCEKPMAVTREEAAEVVSAVDAAGTVLVIGAMHVFEPNWEHALDQWLPELGTLKQIESSIVLPPNPQFESVATELVPRPAGGPPPGAPPHQRIRGSVLGLAIHDLPLVRALAGAGGVQVRHAALCQPFGYVIDMTVGGVDTLLTATFAASARAQWSLRATGTNATLDVAFSPSYVHSGGASATITDANGTRALPAAAANGYEAEWMRLYDALAGGATPPDPRVGLADLDFALDVADHASAYLAAQTKEA